MGYATLQAKWNFLRSGTGAFAVGLAPLVRLPINRRIGGSSQAALGLTWRLSRSLLADLGVSLGLGRNSPGRIVYSGLGWSF